MASKKSVKPEVKISVIARRPFADALTGRSFDRGDEVPWELDRARHYCDLVQIITDEIEPDPEPEPAPEQPELPEAESSSEESAEENPSEEGGEA